jgi:hypothetical protein
VNIWLFPIVFGVALLWSLCGCATVWFIARCGTGYRDEVMSDFWLWPGPFLETCFVFLSRISMPNLKDILVRIHVAGVHKSGVYSCHDHSCHQCFDQN